MAQVAARHYPTPLTQLFGASEEICVGSIDEGEPVVDRAVLERTAPRGNLPGQDVYACRFALHIAAVIKADRHRRTQGSTVPLIWYLPSPSCHMDYLERPLAGPALWFLRSEGDFLRPIADNLEAVRPLRGFTPDIVPSLKRWGHPKLALAYLYLAPGIIVGEQDYVHNAEDGPVIDLVGWAGFLDVLRAVFPSCQPATRGQLCLMLARYGMCLSCARSAMQAVGGLREWDSHLYLLDSGHLRDFENRELRRMSIETTDQLLERYSTLAEARDELTLYACSSSDRLKAQARKLLERFFQVEASALPCPPCGGGAGSAARQPR